MITDTHREPDGLTCVRGRVIQTLAALPGMSLAEGEVIPPVQDKVSDGGGSSVLLITDKILNTAASTAENYT